MHHFYRVLSFLALATTLIQSQQPDADSVSDYCFQCQVHKSYWNLCPDMEGDCHAFYQCQKYNSTYAVGYRMECPPGTFFHHELLTCMPEGDVECKNPCQSVNITDVGCFALPDRCSQFWMCTDASEAFALCCPTGTKINTDTCTCEYDVDGNCTDSCHIQVPKLNATMAPPPPTQNGTFCVDSYGTKLRPSLEDTRYFLVVEKDGTTSHLMQCAASTEFSMETCRCEGEVETVDLPPTPARQCSLYLPFDTDYADHSMNKFYTEKIGQVELAIGANVSARGDGSLRTIDGQIQVLAMTRNNIGSRFSQCFFYRCYDDTCDEIGGLVGNNENENQTDYTVITSSGIDGIFKLDVNTKNGAKYLTVDTGNETYLGNDTNGFFHICTTFSPEQTRLYIGQQLVGSIYGSGPTFGSHAPLSVGSDPSYGPFNGYIDEVLICPYEMTEEEMMAHYDGRVAMQHKGMVPKPQQEAVKYTYMSINTTNATCGHTRYWNNGEEKDTLLQLFNSYRAAPNEFPWLVALFSESQDVKARASIISDRWLLTTASVFADIELTSEYASEWRVFYGEDGLHLGENSTYADYEELYGENWLSVEKIAIHPDFNSSNYQYNFAMVKLNRKLNFNTWAVQPICLPTACNETCQPREIVEVAGYGNSTNDAQGVRTASIPVIGDNLCQSIYNGVPDYDKYLTNATECAGYIESGQLDPCGADAGTPLMCPKHGYFTVDGLASNGFDCPMMGLPGLYAKVCDALDWIEEEMNSN